MKRALTALLLAAVAAACEQTYVKQAPLPADATPDERAAIAGRVVPTPQQLAWQQLELTAFLHFGINTFTGREWGDGQEDPALFDPSDLDAGQWVRTLRDAGFRMVILTAKHHDGFCLWPSRYTDHTVAASPCPRDVVREFSDACGRYGLKFGVYLSPWDRHSPLYGTGRPYDDFFASQLRELLTQYGPVFSVWLDGACGEGPCGKRQVYDWERYYAVIRELQPEACISVCGPDVRWCGNEAGHTRPSEWSVVPRRARDTEKIREKSQTEDSAAFRQREISAGDVDLGSREAVRDEPDLVWYPAEVNTSIRPGWFYHPEEDGRVKSLAELVRIYESSVGGNAAFLLNIPPTPEGLVHENDAARLRELGAYLRETYRRDLAMEARIARRPDTIHLQWPEPVEARRVILMEDITKSQRVERFAVLDGGGAELYAGTVIGYKKIVPLEGVVTDRLTIRILDSRMEPHLAFIGVY